MTHVMIFSYWFPPANAIGSSRPFAMARYFAALGWKVTVIAGASDAVPNSFSADMAGFDVHSVSDPRFTRWANFRAGRGKWRHRFSTLLRLMAWPDHFRPVARAMRKRARRVIAEQGAPDIILSTALPFSTHAAARDVARECGALFVADNRDVWALNSYKWIAPFYRPFEMKYERHVLGSADLVLSTTPGAAHHYRRLYPELADRVMPVMNGADGQRESRPAHTGGHDGIRLVYTGILYGDLRDVTPLLRAAQRVSGRVAIEFYGAETDIVARLARDYPDVAIIDRGRVSRAEAIAAQEAADAVLLVVGTSAWEDMILPGKLFEYIRSGRPIVALANPDSDSGHIITRYELGIATTDAGQAAAFLERLAQPGIPTRSTVPQELTREYQLGLLATRLAELMASRSLPAAGSR